MTVGTYCLGRITGVLVILAVWLAGWTLFADPSSPGRRWFREHARSSEKRLRFLRWPVNGVQVLIVQTLPSTGCVGFVLWNHEWLWLLVSPVFVFGPELLLAKATARRTAQIERQIEPWINAVANALKANPSLAEAIRSATTLVASPICQELDVLVKEHELGTPLDQALENLGRRIQSQTLQGMIAALNIARRSGGNLTEMLETSAGSLREFARLEGIVRTKTAEGKAQAFVIGIMPVPMVLAIRSIDHHFFDPLSHSLLGQLVIAGAVVLWATAIAAARKILDVDI